MSISNQVVISKKVFILHNVHVVICNNVFLTPQVTTEIVFITKKSPAEETLNTQIVISVRISLIWKGHQKCSLYKLERSYVW